MMADESNVGCSQRVKANITPLYGEDGDGLYILNILYRLVKPKAEPYYNEE